MEPLAGVDRPKSGRQKLRNASLWIAAFVCWFFCLLGLWPEGIELLSNGRPAAGGLCLASGFVILIGGVYLHKRYLRPNVEMPDTADFGIRMQELLRKAKKIATWISQYRFFGSDRGILGRWHYRWLPDSRQLRLDSPPARHTSLDTGRLVGGRVSGMQYAHHYTSFPRWSVLNG